MHGIFDHFAKLVTRAAVAPACKSVAEHEVRHDPQRADLFIEPDRARLALLDPLGLLGRVCRRICVLEFFHGTPAAERVEACVAKILALRRERRRADLALPVQWILSSGHPSTALAGFAFERAPRWGPGVYRSPTRLATHIIVASELPGTRDTLLVRLVGGRGHVAERAWEELRALPRNAPERRLAVPSMLELRPVLSGTRGRRSRQVEEFRAMVQPVMDEYDRMFAERSQRAHDEGMAEGIAEGIADSFLHVYAARFGAPPGDLAEAVARTRDPAVLRGWLGLVATGSPEQIAAAVRAPKPASKPRAASRKPRAR